MTCLLMTAALVVDAALADWQRQRIRKYGSRLSQLQGDKLWEKARQQGGLQVPINMLRGQEQKHRPNWLPERSRHTTFLGTSGSRAAPSVTTNPKPESSEHGDEPLRLWAPSWGNPVPVHHVLHHNISQSSSFDSLELMLWKVAWVLQEGCREAKQHQTPEGFAAVVIDQLHGNDEVLHFSDIFDLDHLANVYRVVADCLISDQRTFGEMLLADMVKLMPGAEMHREPKMAPDDVNVLAANLEIKRMYSALQPSNKLHDIFYKPCMAALVSSFGGSDFLAVDMRPEDPWDAPPCKGDDTEHDANMASLQPLGSFQTTRRVCLDAQEAANLILNNTVLAGFRHAFLLNLENRMPNKGTVEQFWFKAKSDPMTAWPKNWTITQLSDLDCMLQSPPLPPLYQASVKFFMAAHSRAFVGTGRSSFSRGVHLHRIYGHHGKDRISRDRRWHTYMYDCVSEGHIKVKRLGPETGWTGAGPQEC